MFTLEEHIENLNRLNINSYVDLIGKNVYYVKPSYGKHKILSFDRNKDEFLLEIDNKQFYSNPFKIYLMENNKLYTEQEVVDLLRKLANDIDDEYRPYHRNNILGSELLEYNDLEWFKNNKK